jgi:ABC-type molybdate transport system ATPase subunit
MSNFTSGSLRASIAEYLDHIIGEFQIPTLLVSHDRESVLRLADSTISIAQEDIGR